MSRSTSVPSEDDVIANLRAVGFKADDDELKKILRSKERGLKAMDSLLKMELKERQIRNLAQRTRMASLGKCKSLDEFDWTHPRTIDRALFEQLTTLTFVEDQ